VKVEESTNANCTCALSVRWTFFMHECLRKKRRSPAGHLDKMGVSVYTYLRCLTRYSLGTFHVRGHDVFFVPDPTT